MKDDNSFFKYFWFKSTTYDFSSNGKFAGTKTKSSVSSGLSDSEGGGEGGLGATGDTPSST